MYITKIKLQGTKNSILKNKYTKYQIYLQEDIMSLNP